MSEKLKISNGVERLIFFGLFLIMFVHVFGCLFIMLSALEIGFSNSLWIDKCSPADFGKKSYNGELYVCSIYYIFTTVCTVGYGDVTPSTSIERIFAMFIMLFGVIGFTFVSGSLASIL